MYGGECRELLCFVEWPLVVSVQVAVVYEQGSMVGWGGMCGWENGKAAGI